MSQIYLGDKLIASTEGSDIKYDENTSVKEKIDELNSKIDNYNSVMSESGTVKTGVIQAKSTYSTMVTFDNNFNKIPTVKFTSTDTGNNQAASVEISDVSTSGFKLTVTNTFSGSAIEATVTWIAESSNSNIDDKKVLFAGANVSSGTITLSDSMNNYDYFKVFHSMGIITEVYDFAKLKSNYLSFVSGIALGKLIGYRYTVTKQSETQLSISDPYFIETTASSTTEGIVKIVGCKL